MTAPSYVWHSDFHAGLAGEGLQYAVIRPASAASTAVVVELAERTFASEGVRSYEIWETVSPLAVIASFWRPERRSPEGTAARLAEALADHATRLQTFVVDEVCAHSHGRSGRVLAWPPEVASRHLDVVVNRASGEIPSGDIARYVGRGYLKAIETTESIPFFTVVELASNGTADTVAKRLVAHAANQAGISDVAIHSAAASNVCIVRGAVEPARWTALSNLIGRITRAGDDPGVPLQLATWIAADVTPAVAREQLLGDGARTAGSADQTVEANVVGLLPHRGRGAPDSTLRAPGSA